MRVLVLGFSVTEDNNGYVEKINSKEDLEITKIGLGGIQPHHLAFIVSDILKNASAEIVVFELATAGFRSLLPQSLYLLAFTIILKNALFNNIKPVVFDIPRSDIVADTDWVFKLNRSICKKYNIQYIAAHTSFEDVVDSYLRDGIHTNEKGAQKLADIFEKNITISNCAHFNPKLEDFPASIRDCDLYIEHVFSNSDMDVEFTRSGYKNKFVTVANSLVVNTSIKNRTYCYGVLYLMGPETGKFQLDFGNVSRSVVALDAHCYYRRLGVTYFPNVEIGEKIVISNAQQRPEIMLLKGELSAGNILNYVGGFMCSNHPSIDVLAESIQV